MSVYIRNLITLMIFLFYHCDVCGEERNREQQIEDFRIAAEQGDGEAQYMLGVMYANGEAAKKDLKEAKKWFQMAAEQGHPKAQYSLAVSYAEGYGTNQDFDEAMKWYLLSAEQGDPDAQYNIGIMYHNGSGTRRDFREAIKWFEKAAEQHCASAQRMLGIMYYSGEGVMQNFQKAMEYYRRASEQGDSQATFNIATMYFDGNGVKRDIGQAVKWIGLAAEQGNPKAQCNLGVMYLTGQGVDQDFEEAKKWLQMAAEQGVSRAQFNLGAMYLNGEGVNQDFEGARKWLQMAAEQGNVNAQHALEALEAQQPRHKKNATQVTTQIPLESALRGAKVKAQDWNRTSTLRQIFVDKFTIRTTSDAEDVRDFRVMTWGFTFADPNGATQTYAVDRNRITEIDKGASTFAKDLTPISEWTVGLNEAVATAEQSSGLRLNLIGHLRVQSVRNEYIPVWTLTCGQRGVMVNALDGTMIFANDIDHRE